VYCNIYFFNSGCATDEVAVSMGAMNMQGLGPELAFIDPKTNCRSRDWNNASFDESMAACMSKVVVEDWDS